MSKDEGKLIVALDVDSLKEACALVDQLKDYVEIYKVGSQLFTACGPEIITKLYEKKKKVFLDLKYHDIPNTVAKAIRAATLWNDGDQSVFMCTLHIVGGMEMLERAVEMIWS